MWVNQYYSLSYQFYWLANNRPIFLRRSRINNFRRQLSTLRFLIRYTRLLRTTSAKKRIFITHMLLHSLITFLRLSNFNKETLNYHRKTRRRRGRLHGLPEYREEYVRRTRIGKRKNSLLEAKVTLLITNLFLYLTYLKYKHVQFNKPIIQTRHHLFQLYAKILLFTLYKSAFIKRDDLLITKFYGLHSRNISAQFLVNYIIIKLGQYFTLNPIIKPVIRRLQRLSYIDGFRFIISGRLTRRERASYIVKSHKAMPLSTYKTTVDYAFDYKIMKFGVVGIKILLLMGRRPPNYYLFEYRDKL